MGLSMRILKKWSGGQVHCSSLSHLEKQNDQIENVVKELGGELKQALGGELEMRSKIKASLLTAMKEEIPNAQIK